MKLSFVIPTFNEAGNIKELLTSINKICIKNKYSYEIIIIDDNSPDGTVNIIKKLNNSNVKVFVRKEKKGLGSAYKDGFKKISKTAELVFMMDADLSHNPNDIPRFVDEINKGYDLVQGSRKVKGGEIESWSPIRYMISYTSSFITRPLMNIKDPNNSYKCLKKEILDNINLSNTIDGFGFLIEFLYLINKKGYKIKEIPIKFHKRKTGKSKLTRKEISKNFKLYVRLYKKHLFSK